MKRLIRFYNRLECRGFFFWSFAYAIACGAYTIMEHRADSLGAMDIGGMITIGAILLGVPVYDVWKDSAER